MSLSLGVRARALLRGQHRGGMCSENETKPIQHRSKTPLSPVGSPVGGQCPEARRLPAVSWGVQGHPCKVCPESRAQEEPGVGAAVPDPQLRVCAGAKPRPRGCPACWWGLPMGRPEPGWKRGSGGQRDEPGRKERNPGKALDIHELPPHGSLGSWAWSRDTDRFSGRRVCSL